MCLSIRCRFDFFRTESGRFLGCLEMGVKVFSIYRKASDFDQFDAAFREVTRLQRKNTKSFVEERKDGIVGAHKKINNL